jgi:hypothetical protein
VTREQFERNHSAPEKDGKINPIVRNQLLGILLCDRVKLACSGKGLSGRFYQLIAKLLPLGVKLYGTYNEIELIAVPGIFQFAEPILYGL